tara:strand:+ start:353035 stop:356340 length:3306 start_codon:yes stop_codon:yes gene_type:complete
MMTYPASSSFYPSSGCWRSEIISRIGRGLFAIIIFAAWCGNSARSQNIIYSQPVTSSAYPSSGHQYQSGSYGVSQPSVIHHSTISGYPTATPRYSNVGIPYAETIISERVISSTADTQTRTQASARPPAPDASTSRQEANTRNDVSRRNAFNTQNESNPWARSDSAENTKSTASAKLGDVTHLASMRGHRTTSSYDRGGEAGSMTSFQPEESRYRLSMIESARHTASQFRLIAQSAPELAATMAIENATFADQWADVAQTYNVLFDRVKTATDKLATTKFDYEDVKFKLSNDGLTPTVGLLLRHKKEQLDTWQIQDSQAVLTSEEISNLRRRQLELEMVRFEGIDPVSEASEILSQAGYDERNPDVIALASQVQRLLRERQQWLASLRRVYEDYHGKLGQLDSATTASAKLASDYRQLIRRHIIWIRSGEPIRIADVSRLRGGFAALFDSRRSEDFGPTVQRKLDLDPASGFALVFSCITILVIRWRAKSWLVGIGSRKRMRESSAAARKVVAGWLTMVVAVSLPAILYLVARWLGVGIVSESTLYASSGFAAAALVACMVEIPRQLFRNQGYVEKHVDIVVPHRERASKYLTLFGFALVVAAYAVTVMGSVDHGMWRGSMARFGFMSAMLMTAFLSHLALRPSGGYVEPFIAKFGGNVIHRVRWVLYAIGLGFPLAMIALSALGYGFTANQLIMRAIVTLVSLMIAATLWAGVKILSGGAWQRLTGSAPPPRQFDEYGEIETDAETVTGTLAEHSLELKHHLAFLCQCALVVGAVVGFGWLWIDVFPGVRMGNPVVWNVQDTVSEATLDAAGQEVTRSVVQTTPVTALHLLLAAGTLFVAFQLAKLLPAMFDALVLQRVSFDEGMEHFSLVLGRVLLFGVGCLIACKLVGMRWQTIQWLAVGLTIGLGFGLQDMVRNLFGGFIVLFEKPAKLGDLITVGRVTGRVATQKFRTTVLSDDEGREVIVPNKKFVSEDVVNWRGAGRLSVIPIEVAVKRDERSADVCRTLQELVIDQDDVLLTPAPQATLVCVGHRSQRIEVRAWIEAGQDAARFRDALLKTVKNYLKDKKLLAADQPPQPGLDDRSANRASGGDAYQNRRRSA